MKMLSPHYVSTVVWPREDAAAAVDHMAQRVAADGPHIAYAPERTLWEVHQHPNGDAQIIAWVFPSQAGDGE